MARSQSSTPTPYGATVAFPDGRIIAFPASMSMDEIHAAAKTLHDNATGTTKPKRITPNRSLSTGNVLSGGRSL